ncbi:MAG: lycopene cyclase domain-containing protein [Bacteroidota bacterium]|nr:lycopene cyclase domain-containing protein [Bacteroidota bacterium]
MTLYFTLLLFTIIFPLIASWDNRFKYVSKFKDLFPSIVITASFFIPWDIIFTINGVWGFSEVHASSLTFFYLPIEEWLFFIVIPFSCLFIYESVIFFHDLKPYNKIAKWILLITGVLLLCVGALNYERSYTFWNFIFCGIFLLYSCYKTRDYHAEFLVAYFYSLIPFFIVNGILTDGNFDFNFTTEPIVWYNNSENLSIRLGTIPFEDLFYCLLLLLMNVTFYEKFKSKSLKNL